MQIIQTYAQIIIFFFSGCLSVSAQDTNFIAVPLDPELIESGENKNFYKYDLGSYNLFVGRYENNLRFKIQNKNTNQIDYTHKNTNSDAMIRIPKFFINKDPSIIVILMEEAAEYS